MRKLLFIPFSVTSGLVAGFVAKKAFEASWGLVSGEEPPDPGNRDASWPALVAALAVEGAVFGVVRGATDHAARVSFYRLTGAWPGDERREDEAAEPA